MVQIVAVENNNWMSRGLISCSLQSAIREKYLIQIFACLETNSVWLATSHGAKDATCSKGKIRIVRYIISQQWPAFSFTPFFKRWERTKLNDAGIQSSGGAFASTTSTSTRELQTEVCAACFAHVEIMFGADVAYFRGGRNGWDHETHGHWIGQGLCISASCGNLSCASPELLCWARFRRHRQGQYMNSSCGTQHGWPGCRSSNVRAHLVRRYCEPLRGEGQRGGCVMGGWDMDMETEET